jgi:bacterial/archaeal transporter family-2 protein
VSRTLAVLVAALGGGLAGMQAPINSRLGKTVGTLQAATFSFLVGTIALLVIVSLASGGIGGIGGMFGRVGRVPWWALVGGLCGAVYVTVALLAVRTLGASGVTVAIVAGQLTIAVAIDRFGLFGIAKQHIAASRIAGLVLVLVGVVLVVRR